MSQNIKTIPTSEYDAVVKTVQTYVDGLAAGDNNIMRHAFHKDATMYGFIADKLLEGPIANLYGYVDSVGKAPNLKARLDVLGITPTTAVVKVDMEKDASGNNYTDFHTLIKLDNKWTIIGKTFHTYAS
ncbi:hypothetical protein KVR01_005456 [Diaporthe batatas]|uniref:uncharacterized protein n=1 Tax=Diaporthe batatas TaxID=748121 RepID=UPI001D059FD1|nr:uncharacterized protein KVR01_005456 [Diaporthe batatas]KAG8165181.1 hypothetical protein KVR01_005456 [Diaporthe batatas]